MAAKRKTRPSRQPSRAANKTPVKKASSKRHTETPAPAPEEGQLPERTVAFVAGKPFFIDRGSAMQFITIEAATRGMNREQLTDWTKRYGVRLEVWTSLTGNTKAVLLDGTKVLGDWI